jgi:hypothetical protein
MNLAGVLVDGVEFHHLLTHGLNGEPDVPEIERYYMHFSLLIF